MAQGYVMRGSSITAFWQRRSFLEKLGAVLLFLFIALRFAGAWAAPVLGLLEFAVLIVGGILAIRYLRVWLRALMWRLRHRLIITYVFIGVVPVLLLVVMAGLAAYIFYGQLATYLVNTSVGRVRDGLSQAAHSVAHDLAVSGGRPDALMREHLPTGLSGIPIEVEQVAQRPEWLKGEFVGVVGTPAGAVVRVAVPARTGLLVVTTPMADQLLSYLVNGVGAVRLLTLVPQAAPRPNRGVQIKVGDANYDVGTSVQAGNLPPAEGRLDIAVTWALTLPQVDWNTGESNPVPVTLAVTSRPSLMNKRLFSTLGDRSTAPLTALAIIATAFLLIEALSLFIGVRLTRTITRAVADLYAGTSRVQEGDFSVRIPMRSRDQLAALAESFNTMTSSLEQLIIEQKEKQRLLSELEIARDVQAQLFPKEVPKVRGLELAALCNPARTVSGDYYDFLPIDRDNIGLAVADIAGKGISAALLMASIQSMLHAQFTIYRAHAASGSGAGQVSSNGMYRTAPLVAQLNQQLQQNIGTGHFATFCCAFFNDRTGELTYTNAGHLPPIILRGGEILRLEKGGVVLGIFPGVIYDEETVRLQRGDLLVGYTDGITEPENSYGEEFGEERLIEVLRHSAHLPAAEIVAAVMAAVREWTASPEQPDDMTIMVARRR